MKYTRTIEVVCEGCGAIEIIRDGDPIEAYVRGKRREDVQFAGTVGRVSNQPVSLTSAVLAVLRRGWIAMTPRGLDGRFDTFRAGAKLEAVPRGLVVVCGSCEGHVIPPLSSAAQRALDEADRSGREMLARVIRLEEQVAVLTGMREAVDA